MTLQIVFKEIKIDSLTSSYRKKLGMEYLVLFLKETWLLTHRLCNANL